MKSIAEAIRTNDLLAYQQARYPAIPDGEELVFEQEDFTSTNFDAFSMGFTAFKHCILDDATHLYGQPITMEHCSAKRIDFTDAQLVLHATDTDFTGMKYSDDTVFAIPENNSPSTFTNCTLDDEAVDFLRSQNVIVE